MTDGSETLPAISRFEDIEAWRKGRELVRLVYDLSSHGHLARDFALRDQMRRAVISVTSNIAEGFERGGNKEFLQFLSMARGSVGELRSQAYSALDVGFVSQQQFDQLPGLAIRTSQLISGLMRYLHRSDYKGAKYKIGHVSSTATGDLEGDAWNVER